MPDYPDSILPFKAASNRNSCPSDSQDNETRVPARILQFQSLILRARSQAESDIYMWLHPCRCGDRSIPIYATCKDVPNAMIVSYRGECPTCGWFHKFIFELPPFRKKPKNGAYGESEPSVIIDPGEWLYVSDHALD